MTKVREIVYGKYAGAITFLLVLIAGLLLSIILYAGKRTITIDVGSFGDGPYLSNFFADEADVDYRYRWTKDHSEVHFSASGSAQPQVVQIRAQGPPSSVYTGTITATFSINGVVLEPASVTMTGQLNNYDFTIPQGQTNAGRLQPPYVLAIDSNTFRPAGDPRNLGIKVDTVTLRQSNAGANLPPPEVLAWWALLLTGLALALTPLRGWLKLALALALAFIATVAFFNSVIFAGAYAPVAAVVVALNGLIIWQRRRLPRWPFAADIPLSKTSIASWAMLAALTVFAAISLWAMPQVVWVGHADYAENANIARSLVEGHGLTVDYVAQFYKPYPGISHPADTWPLLQPLLIAPFFAIFGPATWASKLPNLIIMVALAWGVFALASRLWDSRAGLFAGLLTLVHPYFFNAVLYPINDLPFAAIFLFLCWLVWAALYREDEGRQVLSLRREDEGLFATFVLRLWSLVSSQPAIPIGALAALLIWSKPSGAPLLAGLALWAVIHWWRRYRTERGTIPVRSIALLATAFALVLLPLVVRNIFALGALYFSTESLDVWILRYWPYINWENIYKDYVGAVDYPHPRWIIGGKFGYQNLVDAVSTNFRWVWERGVLGGADSSDFVIGPVPLLGALAGFISLSRRAASLFGMALLSLGLYGLFVLLYWHYEGRYFQVVAPWLYMLTAWGVIRLWDLLRAYLPAGQSTWLGWLLPMMALALLMWPGLDQMQNHLVYDTRPTSFTVAMDWLGKNSRPNDVVMTRDPWELNWYTGRKAVMIPFDDLATIKKVARQYGVTMLQIGGPVDSPDNFESCPKDPDSSRFPTGSRPALGKLYCGFDMPGFTRIYQNNDLMIYRLTQ